MIKIQKLRIVTNVCNTALMRLTQEGEGFKPKLGQIERLG